MFSLPYLCICAYCMLQLGFMIGMENRHRYARVEQGRYFLCLLIITQFSFAADLLSSIHADTAFSLTITSAGNYLEIILNTLLLPIFFRFICGQIGNLASQRKRRLNVLLWTMAALCVALVLSNAFTGKIFYYDDANQYHRGAYFMLPMSIILIMMAVVEGFLVSQRRKIEVGYYKSITLFFIAPLVGWTLQSVVYGLPFSLMGIAFAALVVFTNNQNRNIDTDYLTGVFNRKTLDNYLQQRIDSAKGRQPLSAILLDIDNFKSINDRFGHFEGDMALINSVRILRGSVGRADFISRYGGDEFIVILGCDHPNAVEEAKRAIQDHLSAFNRSNDKPYHLSFSMGTASYRRSSEISADSFLKLLDQRMYEEKEAHKTCDNPIPKACATAAHPFTGVT